MDPPETTNARLEPFLPSVPVSATVHSIPRCSFTRLFDITVCLETNIQTGSSNSLSGSLVRKRLRG